MERQIMTPKFADDGADAVPISVIRKEALNLWLSDQDQHVANWVAASGFKADLGQILPIPDDRGRLARVLFGWGDMRARARGRFHLAAAVEKLPAGTYRVEAGLTEVEARESALGWLLATYRFTRYAGEKRDLPQLVAPEGVDVARIQATAAAAFLARDLINTPASDMGPDALQDAFESLAAEFGASSSAIVGDDLIQENLPLIHAVGRAAGQAPRLLDLRWGKEGRPRVTLVGKGVCFDTGGLNLKPGASMGLMKKDMGGAATVMGLARMIMALDLPVQLRVLIPAVENAVSGSAMRPGDILPSRKGLTVEVNNTDAEGRLVLADALAMADEEAPDYLFCMATLTGAARVALGPGLVPFYTDDDSLAHQLARAGRHERDPLWRMPLWDPYENRLEPGIADLDNAPSGGFAGSIMAALFLRRFVENADLFAHFDIYGWNPEAAPARPKGAAFQAARAIFHVLHQELSE